jgi:hypothetical protein
MPKHKYKNTHTSKREAHPIRVGKGERKGEGSPHETNQQCNSNHVTIHWILILNPPTKKQKIDSKQKNKHKHNQQNSFLCERTYIPLELIDGRDI